MIIDINKRKAPSHSLRETHPYDKAAIEETPPYGVVLRV
jgi:hypothetical protein